MAMHRQHFRHFEYLVGILRNVEFLGDPDVDFHRKYGAEKLIHRGWYTSSLAIRARTPVLTPGGRSRTAPVPHRFITARFRCSSTICYCIFVIVFCPFLPCPFLCVRDRDRVFLCFAVCLFSCQFLCVPSRLSFFFSPSFPRFLDFSASEPRCSLSLT